MHSQSTTIPQQSNMAPVIDPDAYTDYLEGRFNAFDFDENTPCKYFNVLKPDEEARK